MKIINMYGKYLDENSGVITCPVCGRKRSVVNEYGDLRGVVHCRCKTGKQRIRFNFDVGGVYVYKNENGDQIVL